MFEWHTGVHGLHTVTLSPAAITNIGKHTHTYTHTHTHTRISDGYHSFEYYLYTYFSGSTVNPKPWSQIPLRTPYERYLTVA